MEVINMNSEVLILVVFVSLFIFSF